MNLLWLACKIVVFYVIKILDKKIILEIILQTLTKLLIYLFQI